MDARMKLACRKHIDQRAHAGAALLDQVVPGVDGEMPDRGRTALDAQGLLEIERRLAAQPAVDDEHAVWREQREVGGNRRAGDGNDDGVDAATAGDGGKARSDVLIIAVSRVIGPELTGKARLGFTAGNA